MMGLSITLIYNGSLGLQSAYLHFSYSAIHILRQYACEMVGAVDESDTKAKESFPNLVWHSDCEGYYVPYLPDGWSLQNHLWVGNLNGLYAELSRVSAHMIQTNYEGSAKKVLGEMLKLFAEAGYDSEEPGNHAVMSFT